MAAFTAEELAAIAEAERAGKVRRFGPGPTFSVLNDNRDPQRQRAARRAAEASAEARRRRAGPSCKPRTRVIRTAELYE